MESAEELRERERELVAERAAAAPYVDYPPTPRWYPPFMGLWATGYTAVLGVPREHAMLQALGQLVLLVVMIGFQVWYRRYRGTWPRGKAPAEVRRVLAAFVVGAVVVIGLVALALWLGPLWIAVVVAFVLVTIGVSWYEAVYARAAARTRTRLGGVA